METGTRDLAAEADRCVWLASGYSAAADVLLRKSAKQMAKAGRLRRRETELAAIEAENEAQARAAAGAPDQISEEQI